MLQDATRLSQEVFVYITHTYVRTYIWACSNLQHVTSMSLEAYVRNIHACIHTYMHTEMYKEAARRYKGAMYTYTYTHTYINTEIHTYIHTCIHTYRDVQRKLQDATRVSLEAERSSGILKDELSALRDDMERYVCVYV
jgi:hypothetical protein